ncbi:glycoside hydrolase family 5 protein, partial [bacterium]|nr:glycoside hydrolase family 5 protein [bacterium]
MRFFLVLFLFVSLQADAITIKNGQFLEDGKPIFLLGLSYFDGLSASPRILESDLNFFGERGFNALRVWANWYPDFQPKTTGLLEPDGSVNIQMLNRLQSMIEIAGKRGFVIKLTFSRHPLEDIQFPKYKNGILAVVKAIKDSDNILLDLQNETDHCGTRSDPNCLGHLSSAQVRELRDAIKEIDPDRIVTAS